MKNRLIKNEDGAVLPFVALLLAFVLIGFTALIIDAGVLYAERRSMVTAADAAALGGAMIVQDALSDETMNWTDIVQLNELEDRAKKVALDLAVKNGVADTDDIIVDVVWDDTTYNRDVIKVTVKNTKSLFFAKVFGSDTSDVAADAVATWGYDTKIEGGDILPIFTKDGDYQSDTFTYLHAGKIVNGNDIVGGNWGLIDIYGNTTGIADALRGDSIGQRMELNYTIDNQTGFNAGNLINPIEDRMITANSIEDKTDRIKFMNGLVPVIDWDNITVQGSSLKLPIAYFAVFEIYDVIVNAAHNEHQKSEGSRFALYDTSDYKSDNIAIKYDKVDGQNLEKATIIGKFTDQKVAVRAIMEPGDQENPDPSVISATYSKLID